VCVFDILSCFWVFVLLDTLIMCPMVGFHVRLNVFTISGGVVRKLWGWFWVGCLYVAPGVLSVRS